jgi:hypothetical protein
VSAPAAHVAATTRRSSRTRPRRAGASRWVAMSKPVRRPGYPFELRLANWIGRREPRRVWRQLERRERVRETDQPGPRLRSRTRPHPSASVRRATMRPSSANAPQCAGATEGGDERAGGESALSARAPANRIARREPRPDGARLDRRRRATKNPPPGTVTRFPRPPLGTTFTDRSQRAFP